MKHIAFLLSVVAMAMVLNSCFGFGCSSCKKRGGIAMGCCENKRVVREEVQDYVEERVYVPGTTSFVSTSKSGLGKQAVTTPGYYQLVRRPVVKVVEREVPCGTCGSTYCPEADCCGIVSKSVLSRASAQGWSGEPHIGQIPTMKVLAPDLEEF